MLFLSLMLAAQAVSRETTPIQPLPPANALPMSSDDEGAVMNAVNALFAAFNNRDGAAVLAQTRSEGVLVDVHEEADGSRKIYTMPWARVAGMLKPEANRSEERLSEPAIEIDGDIAMVWAPYVNYVNGKADHCGVDLMDMVRENGVWKVVNVTSSHRSHGCMPQ